MRPRGDGRVAGGAVPKEANLELVDGSRGPEGGGSYPHLPQPFVAATRSADYATKGRPD